MKNTFWRFKNPLNPYFFIKIAHPFVLRFSERLTPDATIVLDNDTDDIPVIPDLEEFQDDDMAHQVAAPPR